MQTYNVNIHIRGTISIVFSKNLWTARKKVTSTCLAVRAAVIVAHPDDEILWAGGAILARPDWDWFVLTLCRAQRPRPRPAIRPNPANLCRQMAKWLIWTMAPSRRPWPPTWSQQTILASLPQRRFDRVLTHGPAGEYTRHRRHEEVCRAVVALWQAEKLTARRLWMFAYEDGGRQYLPRPRTDAHVRCNCPKPSGGRNTV